MFFILIFSTTISIKSYDIASDILKTVLDQMFAVEKDDTESDDTEPDIANEGISDNMDTIKADLTDSLYYKMNMVELSGSILKKTGTRSYYDLTEGISITSNGYSVGRYNEISTDYEVKEMLSFKEYLDSKDINLLYVNEPTKYIDDSFYQDEFGRESYTNRNTDLFLSRISEAGIDYLDLRESIKEENLEPLSLFYRTDHHWTVPASEWAAGEIAQKLNDDFGYEIDLTRYDPDVFSSVYYKDSWLGETGKKVAKSYIGLEDYIMMKPLYSTSFSIINPNGNIIRKGDFNIFIDRDVYFSSDDYYSASSWHYSYNGYKYKGNTIHNNNVDYGNILVIGDSYEASMLPFLSLGVENVKLVVLREIEGSIRDYIESGNYDTVIIAYAQFMIGAHEDEDNANYRMFTLD